MDAYVKIRRPQIARLRILPPESFSIKKREPLLWFRETEQSVRRIHSSPSHFESAVLEIEAGNVTASLCSR